MKTSLEKHHRLKVLPNPRQLRKAREDIFFKLSLKEERLELNLAVIIENEQSILSLLGDYAVCAHKARQDPGLNGDVLFLDKQEAKILLNSFPLKNLPEALIGSSNTAFEEIQVICKHLTDCLQNKDPVEPLKLQLKELEGRSLHICQEAERHLKRIESHLLEFKLLINK